MPVIEVKNLIKAFGAARAVDDVSFDVEAGEILVIVGSSGCGKTTTLRCIAGLEQPTEGSITIAGQLVASGNIFVAPERRGVGMVFQSYALWPHMTVFDNIAYGLKIKKTPTAALKDAVAKVVDLVGLRGMEDRYPSTLSGGQQQRVALARSAVAEPKVLLLDEPLSNLDAKLREQMRTDLRHLIKKLQITAVHITHDQTEAMAIADRIVYMRSGKMEQMGTPRDLYRMPINRAVADFVGSATFINGTVIRSDDSLGVLVKVSDKIEIWARPSVSAQGLSDVTVAVRPENVMLSRNRQEGPEVFPAKIVLETFLGDHTEYSIDVGGVHLRARSGEDFPIGADVYAAIDPQRVICLPRGDR